MKINIRILYLYLFSFVGLLIIVIGSVNLVNLGLKTFVFPDADRYDIAPIAIQVAPNGEATKPVKGNSEEDQVAMQNRELKRQRERQLAEALAMLAVGIPLYLYHWKTIQKEEKSASVA